MGDHLQAGKPFSWYVASHPGQLSLAIPPWVGTMSTSDSWDVNRHTTRCTSPVSVVWQCKLESGWGLNKRRSAPPCGPYGSGRTLRFFLYVSVILMLGMVSVLMSSWQNDCKSSPSVFDDCWVVSWSWLAMFTIGERESFLQSSL